jgi:NitT/TauT family transport system substrate-binding protein
MSPSSRPSPRPASSGPSDAAFGRRGLFGLAGAIGTVGAISACGSAVTGKKNGGGGSDGGGAASGKVRVGHLSSSLFAPLYVAQAKKFFDDEDLEIELVPLKSGQDGVPMLANDKLDVMVAGFSAGMFNALSEGLKFKVVGSMGISPGDPENSPTALMVRKELADDGTISEIADLKGHKIGAAGGPGATGGYLLAAMLKTGGLTLKDVEIANLDTPDQEPALKNGSVDAATPSAPFSTSIEKSGVGKVLAVPDKGVTGTGVIYSETFVDDSRAQPFFTALTKGAQELSADGKQTDEVYEILADATGQKLDVLKSSPMYSYLEDLAPQPEQLENMQDVWMEGDEITYTDPIDVSGIVDDSFAKGTEG